MNTTILEQQAARVVALRKELKVAERQLAESAAIFGSEGHSAFDFPPTAFDTVNWRQSTKAFKRLGLSVAGEVVK